MSDLEKTCPTCMRPLASSTGGLVTQMIGVCRCAHETVEPTQDLVPLQLCGHCNKPIQRSRAGSLTQWIFSEGRCTCSNPMPVAGFAIKDEAELPAADDWLNSDEDELPLMPGTFPIQRYSPRAQLGAGAAGIVYVARDRLLNKLVAVKTLRQLTSEQLILFQEEARITSKLNHPNIIQILDFGPTDSGAPYMVLEYIENVVSLEQLIRANGPLSPVLAIDIFIKVLDGLSHAHDLGVFHRDIKPSNIVLVDINSSVLDVKLIDFGVAKVKATMKEPGYQGTTLAGTPAYMGPEQASGLVYDSRSEIYSIGCVLFEALTNTPPYSGESPMETISMHANSPIPTLVECGQQNYPAALQKIISKCLAKSQADRYGSAKELKEALLTVKECLSTNKASLYETLAATGFGTIRESKHGVALVACTILGVIGVLGWLCLAPLFPDNKRSETKHSKASKEQRTVVAEHAKLDEQLFGSELVIEGKTIRDLQCQNRDKITAIRLIDCKIDEDASLDDVAKFPNLRHFVLNRCRGLSPAALSRLTLAFPKSEGIALEMSNMKLPENVFDFVARMKTVCYLNLSGADITDEDLQSFRAWNELLALDLSDTNISDKGAKRFYTTSYLLLLRLENCPNISAPTHTWLVARYKTLTEPIKLESGDIRFSLHYQAATRGSAGGQYYLAEDYLYGRGVPVDYRQAEKWYLKSAGQGLAAGQRCLGYLYEHYLIDYKKALYWFQKAAKSGDASAMNNIGCMYVNATGVKKDLNQAIKWLRKSADLGDVNGLFNLAQLYSGGIGVPRDFAEAARYYRKAVDKGHAGSEGCLGVLYLNGYGVPRNQEEALRLISSGADKGDKNAQHNLAVLYEKGTGVSRDEKRALQWYLKAARQGYTDSKVALGVIYFYGRGVEQNNKKAMEWLNSAAEDGSKIAYLNLGMIYKNGKGVPCDFRKAADYFDKAATLGDVESQNQLGFLYEHGYGVEKSMQRARELYQKAAALGNINAKKRLQQMQTGSGTSGGANST